MAKKDLISELETLGVELSGKETVPELEALLADKKEAAEESVATEENSDEAVDEESSDDSETSKEDAVTKTAASEKGFGDSVDVLSGKNFIRYYSKETHGADFLKLAQGLVNKPEYATRNYKLVPSSHTSILEVRYREKADAEKSIDEQSPDSPMMDKRRRFEDRDEALAFSVIKHGSIVAIGAK